MAISTYTPLPDRIIHNTEVDFQTRTQLGMTVHLVQYDKSLPIVAVALYSNGQPYQIPTGAEMNVRVGKRDGTKVYNPVLGCNANRTICYFEVTQQMTSAYGPTLAILELIVDGAIAGSSYIPLDIAKNPAQDEAIMSSNEYKSMNEIVAEAREALGKPPKIQNGTWWLWDSEQKTYVDTGSPTQGEIGPQGKSGEKGEPGRGLTILGYYATESELSSTVTNPKPGDAYGVGSGNPYDIYIWDGASNKWVNNGVLQGAQGETGQTGNGIASTILNDDYTLTFTFTDGTSYTTPTSIRGEIGPIGPQGIQGLTGKTGATGAKGEQGKTGETGNGIASTVLNDDFTLTVHFTDGTSYTTPSIRGATGPQGKQGEKGETGSGFKVLGYYATESALSAAVPNPAAGDAYGIGSADPYDIYIWDGVNSRWVNNGALQGAKGEQGIQGIQGEQGVQGIQGPAGKDGKTPVVGDNGNWYIDGMDTGKPSRGATGPQGTPGPNMVTDTTTTSLNGLLKGDGTHVTTAVPGVDYIMESDLYVCTVTSSGTSYTCNKTLADITEASEAGKIPVVRYNSATYWLVVLTETTAMFTLVKRSSTETITVNATGTTQLGFVGLQTSTSVVVSTTPVQITLNDNTEYYLDDVQSLTITFPTGDFSCWMRIQTAESGTITVTFPATVKYIGEAPTFGAGETWELSVKDGVVIAMKETA